jgi:hypothetical protein
LVRETTPTQVGLLVVIPNGVRNLVVGIRGSEILRFACILGLAL